jgi:biopolymer transport protein ExbD
MAEFNSSPKTKSRSSLKKLSVRVDLTAMVDLAFLLITFFMLTTTLAKPKAMQLAMPVKGTPGGVSEKTTMTICLGKNNQVLWYLGMADKPLTTPKLVDYGKNGLRRVIVETSKLVFRATGKNLMVLIKPASHSVYANLVAALDELDINKVSSYAIADISPKDIVLLKQHYAY